jgi:hypothetical protein
MFIGIMLAMASFVVSYSSSQTVSSAALQTSTVIRTFEERAALIAHRGKVVTITLKGYIFFGSAVKILEDIKSHVTISVPELSPQQLMQLQHQQQLALANAATPSKTVNTGTTITVGALTADTHGTADSVNGNGDIEQPPTEATSLLQGNKDASPRYDGQGSRTTEGLIRSEDRKMSFRVGGKKRSPDKAIADSAAKKLFPDVSVSGASVMSGSVSASSQDSSPRMGSRMNSVTSASDAQNGAGRHRRSGSTASNAHAASVSLTVYDMSPETLRRAIEDRQQERSAETESFGAFASAREVCTGSGHVRSAHTSATETGVSQSLPKHPQGLSVQLHQHAQPPHHAHSSSLNSHQANSPATTAPLSVGIASADASLYNEPSPPISGLTVDISRPSADIEMGPPRGRDANSPGRSLLTKHLEELQSPAVKPLPQPLNLPGSPSVGDTSNASHLPPQPQVQHSELNALYLCLLTVPHCNASTGVITESRAERLQPVRRC